MHPDYRDIFGDDQFNLGFEKDSRLNRILITGAQGMLGNALASALIEMYRRRLIPHLDLVLASRSWNWEAKQHWKKNDNVSLVENSEIADIEEIDLGIHAASPSNITKIDSFLNLQKVNLGIIETIANLNPKKILFISSGEIYKSENLEEGMASSNLTLENKRDWYPMAKLEAEGFLRARAQGGSFNADVIRLFHTYGPGVKKDDGRSFADILWGASIEGEITLSSNGNQVRSFLYLGDAVRGILTAAFGNSGKFRISNLGSEEALSILEFAKLVARPTNAQIVYKINDQFSHSPNNFLVPQVKNLKNAGWEPTVSIETGINRTVKWIRNSFPDSK